MLKELRLHCGERGAVSGRANQEDAHWKYKMRPLTLAFVVAGVAVAVPLVVIAFGQGLARYAKWAEAGHARRTTLALITAGIYLAIGLLELISQGETTTGWIFCLLAAGLVLAAWYDARHRGPSEPGKP